MTDRNALSTSDAFCLIYYTEPARLHTDRALRTFPDTRSASDAFFFINISLSFIFHDAPSGSRIVPVWLTVLFYYQRPES